MKLDEVLDLSSELDLDNILVKPEEVILSMEEKGDLQNTFPIPDCSNCEEKCCPPGVAISLFDLARFIDIGLDKFIAGAFEGYIELFLSDNGGEDVKLSRPYMAGESPKAKDCIFLDEERKCSIYENRPFICRSYPVAVRLDENRRKLAIWMGGCKKYKISDDTEAFQRLLLSSVQDYNEKVTANSLLMYSRNRLREKGYGKYMEDDWKILIDYNKRNKELQKKVNDLQEIVDRLRIPQDYNSTIQRLQTDNDWLKERLVNIEKEMIQQSERAHSVISDLTTQVSSEYRKLLESILQLQSQSHENKGLWRK